MVHHTMNAKSAPAPRASSNNNHMSHFLRVLVILGSVAGLLAGCATPPGGRDGVPVEDRSAPALPGASSASSASEAAAGVPPGAAAPIDRARSRWWPVDWSALPGWDADRTLELWPALLRGCERPAAGWAAVCEEARRAPPADDAAARAWLQARLQPYRVEDLAGKDEGLITGYFEPLIEASRVRRGPFQVAVHALPLDLTPRKPYFTRQQLDTQPAAQAGLKGRELAWLADPLDLLILQIQGSGRLNITEADGSRKAARMAFAGHNEQPYKSVGRWLIEQGELRAEQASWPAIKSWAQRNPRRINEMLWANPRVVFFREEALPDPTVGPKGAQGVPLTPGRSVAVDAQSVPYGTPMWLDTTEPLANTPLRRAVMAQDTGSAITGGVRADFFWGWGDNAEQQAGRMKQALRVWVLWPLR